MQKISEKTLDTNGNRHMKLINTIGDRCKVCYTCVRDCPAKAIRIINGQAEVIPERCVGCGNCVRVCSQNAKQYYNSIRDVRKILGANRRKAVVIAPSFPAEFRDIPPEKLCGMLKKCGFDMVFEVAFGADLVSLEYRKLLKNSEGTFIGSTCPGIVAYVEKYHPDLIPNLAPVVSPMVATVRALHTLYGSDFDIVFIGPCIAKKAEAVRYGKEEIAAVLTFSELRTLFNELRISQEKVSENNFDPPRPGLGALYALSGGILQSADMREDLLNSQVICADGKNNFVTALEELEKGYFSPRLLELLCCKGCIAGAGMSCSDSAFSRRNAVSSYVREKIAQEKTDGAERDGNDEYERILNSIDMTAGFENDDHRLPTPSEKEIQAILERMGKFSPEDELDCEACGYKTCREHAVAIHKGLAENEMCLPYTIERLKESLHELNLSHSQLEETKQALFNAEKLASMGQLSAGIAHEINNPLGVILLNANLLLDCMDKENDDYEDVKLIAEQAERCRKIVSGLLDFARKNKVILQPVNIVDFINHFMKSILKSENITIVVDTAGIENPEFELDKDQLAQVFTNLVVNACEAMQPEGGTVRIELSDAEDSLRISVKDTGPGIPEEYINKIFEPLFTTKQIGKGTGLGLAVTYGIIKMHHGRITVNTKTDPAAGPTGTEFIITIPRKGETTNGTQ